MVATEEKTKVNHQPKGGRGEEKGKERFFFFLVQTSLVALHELIAKIAHFENAAAVMYLRDCSWENCFVGVFCCGRDT